MPHNWLLRPYREGDEDKVFELQKAAYPEKQANQERWLKWWYWKHHQAPYGTQTWLAEENGKIIARQTAIFTNLKVGKDIVKAAQLVDSMTHPGYRRQGIMVAMSRNTLDELQKSGFHIVYGFPTLAAYKKNKKLGYFDIAAMHKMVKVFKWEDALKAQISNKFLLKLGVIGGSLYNYFFCRGSRVPVIDGLTVAEVTRFDERVNELWDRVSGQFEIAFEKKQDLLNWRFTAVPDASYSIYIAEKAGALHGYLVMQHFQDRFKKTAEICDLLADSPEISQCLLHTAVARCLKEGACAIRWAGLANKAYLKAFRKTGFISLPFRKKGGFNVHSSHPGIPEEFLKDPRKWLVQMGDSDHL